MPSAPAVSAVSGLSRSIAAPRARRMPRLLPRAKPVFSPGSRTMACGNSCRIIATAPSLESLSTTITSTASPSVCAAIERRQARSNSRVLRLTMTIEMSGSSPIPVSYHARAARRPRRNAERGREPERRGRRGRDFASFFSVLSASSASSALCVFLTDTPRARDETERLPLLAEQAHQDRVVVGAVD